MKTCLSCNITYDDSKNFCKKCGSALVEEQKLESREAAKKQVLEDRLKADSLNKGLLLEYAQFLFGNNLYKDAVAVLLKILALDEKDVTATDLLFQAYQHLQMHKEAGETGKQLLASRPDDSSLLEDLVEIFAKLNHLAEVVKYCDQLLLMDSGNEIALMNKADVLLKENDLVGACTLFSQAYQAGKRDEVVVLYTGIDKALKSEFENAVNDLVPVLNEHEENVGNIHLQRGILYLAYSLCSISADLAEIKQWNAKLDLELLKKHQLVQDENAVLEITSFVVDACLDNISASADSKHELDHLIKAYLSHDYFSSESSAAMAGLWHKVGNIEAKFVSVSDAILSFQNAVELMPQEPIYVEALAGAKAELTKIQKKWKHKKAPTYAMVFGFIAIIIGSIFLYKFISEKNTWNEAVRKNTIESYRAYITQYPGGEHSVEADSLLEEAYWNFSKETNTIEGYRAFISRYPSGENTEIAYRQIEELMWTEAIKNNNELMFFDYLRYFPDGKYYYKAIEKTEHVIQTKNPNQIQTLYPSEESYKIYLPNVNDVSHYFNFPPNIRINFSISSQDYGYNMNIWSNGTYKGVFKGDPNGKLPLMERGQIRFIATSPNQLIKIEVIKMN